MAGANAGAVIAMEILVEQDQVAPMRILLKFFCATVDWPATPVVA
jgi:hypothetical protein